METNILNSKGQQKGAVDLPENIFKATGKNSLIHEVIQAYLANQRKGTHETLTRGNVSGGGKKPWKQKHTGRARSGSSRSPLWRGGGIIFGPHPRSYRVGLPHKKIEQALALSLTSKFESGDLVITERPSLEKGKTKEVTEWRKSVGLEEKTLLVLKEKDDNLTRCSRNLKDFKLIEWKSLHPYHILDAKKVAIEPEVIECLKMNGQS